MALSRRGANWADHSGDLTIWTVVKDLWHPIDNPDGYLSLGVAENALMHGELQEYIHKHTQVPAGGLTYGDGGSGSKALQRAMGRFLTRKLEAVVPIESSHVCITNGVTTGVEHLVNILADPGDALLLGQPHYGAFIDDGQLRTGAEIVKVAFGEVDPVSIQALHAYESVIKACLAKSQRVAGIILCNPHNPLGRCYSREFLVGLLKLCQKYQVHLISDEIYALSVFRGPEAGSDMNQFTSAASIPTNGLIDPALVHILYGLSKDFGANGLRLGCIVSQNNAEIHKALVSIAIFSYASSLSEGIATKLLTDDEFVDWYIRENNRRLYENYKFVVEWAERHGIEYGKGVNAAFFLWVNLGKVSDALQKQNRDRAASIEIPQEPPGKPQATQVVDEVDTLEVITNKALLDAKVFLASGAAFGSEKPGWFRIVFSQSRENLMEGFRRIEGVLGLHTSKATSRYIAKL